MDEREGRAEGENRNEGDAATDRSRRGETAWTATGAGSFTAVSSNSVRASPIACKRFLRSFPRHHPISLRIFDGTAGQSGSLHHLGQRLDDRFAFERSFACQQFVDNCAERPDVGAAVGVLPRACSDDL